MVQIAFGSGEMSIKRIIAWFYSLRNRLIMVQFGASLVDVFKILVFGILVSVPQKRLAFVSRFLHLPMENLLKSVQFSIYGNRFYNLDFESFNILHPKFESWMSDYLKLGSGDTFIDVGAHLGKYAISAARIVGERGKVIAIEPHPRNFEILNKNININNLQNVTALNLACWKRNETLKLFEGDKSGQHSVKEDFNFGAIEVQAKKLDDVLKEFDMKRVDSVKIDVEGAEVEVLQGMEATIKRYKPKIVVEVYFRFPQNEKKIVEYAKKHNYHATKATDNYLLLYP